jgi:TPR repeat protein
MKKIYVVVLAIAVSQIALAQNKNTGYFDAVIWGTYELNPKKMLKNLKPLAKAGDIYSQYLLGEMYQLGQGIEQDSEQAAYWYRKAAEHEHALAQCKLSQLLFWGRGVVSDKDEAMRLALKAAQQGSAEAQNNLGYLHKFLGNREVAIFWMRKAAQQGDAIHQYLLAMVYYETKPKPGDEKKSLFWIRKAAEQGLARAEYMLGVHYMYGQGTAIDTERALFWYHRAAAQGDYDAAEAIGRFYSSEKSGHKDAGAALEWNCKAGHLGSNDALRSLLYYPGGASCVLEIANNGNDEAQRELGIIHEREKQPEMAVTWFRKSAAQGNEYALDSLVEMYAKGIGVPRDVVVATALYNIRYSGMGGSSVPNAVGDISLEQKEEAKMLAATWKPGTPLPEKSRTGR